MDWRFSTFLLFMAALLIGVPWATSETGLCSSDYVTGVLKDHTKDGALNCLDFWLNRYQTLAGALFALIAALVTFIPIRGQLREIKIQSKRLTYDTLRARHFKINETLEIIDKISSSSRDVTSHVERYTRRKIEFGSGGDDNIRLIRESSSRISALAKDLDTRFGPTWGPIIVQKSRSHFMKKAMILARNLEVFDEGVMQIDKAQSVPPESFHNVINIFLDEIRKAKIVFELEGDVLRDYIVVELEDIEKSIDKLENELFTN